MKRRSFIRNLFGAGAAAGAGLTAKATPRVQPVTPPKELAVRSITQRIPITAEVSQDGVDWWLQSGHSGLILRGLATGQFGPPVEKASEAKLEVTYEMCEAPSGRNHCDYCGEPATRTITQEQEPQNGYRTFKPIAQVCETCYQWKGEEW